MTTLPPYNSPAPVREGRGILFWVAAGCSGCLLVLVAFVAAVYFGVVVLMKASTPVTETMERARKDPRVVAALGEPIKTGYFFRGTLNTEDEYGRADIAFPISGPKDEARVRVVATKVNGGWSFQTMTVDPDKGPPIDILHE
jgi:hypothetical protein